MTLIYGERGCGKTYRLIKWSAKTGGWIYTNSYSRKQYIEDLIARMNLQGKAHVFCNADQDFRNGINYPKRDVEICIDDVEEVLKQLFPQNPIKEITYSGEKKRLRYKLNKNK